MANGKYMQMPGVVLIKLKNAIKNVIIEIENKGTKNKKKYLAKNLSNLNKHQYGKVSRNKNERNYLQC